jgi:hypothetical protein
LFLPSTKRLDGTAGAARGGKMTKLDMERSIPAGVESRA